MKQRGIIVGVNIDNIENFEELMIELENLCEACNIDVVGEVTQNSKKVNSTYYIGRGKVDELVAYVSSLEVDILIFNNELSTSQVKNIEGKVKCDVVDRTALILEIFASRAKTREAKLQVEVARLKYELPRLIGANTKLSRVLQGLPAICAGQS